jgi:hypothetical protein
MAESQADRLKRELRFLKESYEAGIISEEEYNKGKSRIEGKLAEWGEGVVEEYKRDNIRETEDIIEEDKESDKEDGEEEKSDKTSEEDDEDIFSSKKNPNKSSKEIKKPAKKHEEIFEDEFGDDEGKKPSIWKIVAAVIVVAAVIAFFLMNQNKIKADFNTDYVILTDKNCASCDTRSAEAVIEKLFPNMTKSYVDYNTKQGKALYNIGIKYLPAYIFKQSIEQTETWNLNGAIRNSFEKKGEFWVLGAEQTGSNWKPK